MAAGEKTVVQNRKARHDFQVLERYEAGMALQGTEVKSLRDGKIQLADCYADEKNGELWLVGAHISPYSHGTAFNHQADRPRKLLMKRDEIERLAAQVAEKGLTLVPLRIYFKRGMAKCEIGLCRGKKAQDKRETIKERDAKREMERAMKDARK